MISEQLPYSPGLVLGEEGGGVNARDMGGVSVRRRDIPYTYVFRLLFARWLYRRPTMQGPI